MTAGAEQARESVSVVYDISMLGISYRDPSLRSGIFRVVEQLARGLADSPDCELRFSAVDSLRAFHRSTDYLASHPEFSAVPLLAPRAGKGVVRALDAHVAAIGSDSAVPFRRRVVRKALSVGIAAVETVVRGAGAAVGLVTGVFHSPFHALPRGTGGGPRFLTVYDMAPALFPQHFTPGMVRHMSRVYRSLRRDDWAMAISHATKADLCSLHGIDPSRVFVTHLAADRGMFYPVTDSRAVAAVRQRFNIPDGPYLLGVNTLEPRKNLVSAIRAFTQLVQQERVRDLSLVIAGSKRWKPDSIFAAIESGGTARDRFVLTGHVPDGDLAALYSGALAFIYPSFYEGFGLPPLEAMQCGVPVITSNTSSLPEVVGDAGIMVAPADIDRLCQAMLDVYRDPALRERMRERSLAQAARFSWERCVQETVTAYRTALAA